MSEYTVAQAKTQLSKLIDRALSGETVTITRRGKPTVSLAPAQIKGGRVDLEEVRRLRVTPLTPVDTVALIRQMRDEGA